MSVQKIYTQKLQRTYWIEINGLQNNGEAAIGSLVDNANLLSLEFHVDRPTLGSGQRGVFRIKNLSPQTRNIIYKDAYDWANWPTIKVQAGYVGQPLSTIFNGVISLAYSGRSEGAVDFITTIEAFDYSAFVRTKCHTTTPIQNDDGIKLPYVIDLLLNDIINKASNEGITISKGVISKSYAFKTNPKTLSLDGWSWDLVQTYTDKTCFIDNGEIYCLQNNEAFTYGDTTEVSAQTGLLGTPRKEGNTLIVDMLFEPQIGPGQQIDLQLTTTGLGGNDQLKTIYNGTYKCSGVKHSGIISSSESGKCKTTATILLTDQQISTIYGTKLPENKVYN